MSPDSASRRYRRRTRWPILAVLVLLLAGAVVVWTQILKPAPAEATGCNEPGPAPTSQSTTGTGTTSPASTAKTTGSKTTGPKATGSTGRSPASSARTTGTRTNDVSAGTSTSKVSTTLGTFTDPNVLAAIRPADPSRVPLRVLNASDVTGQAKTVTDELRSAGFTTVGQPENDPLYPAWDLRCYGEIRYGYAGLAEARTVLLVAPCAQLVRDERSDNSIDLSLGKLYQVQPVSEQVRQQLTEIKNAAAPPPVIEGQTISVRPLPTIPPLPDRSGCPS